MFWRSLLKAVVGAIINVLLDAALAVLFAAI